MGRVTRIKRILAPVDFSKPSLAALRYATAFAKSRRARIEVLHVVEAVTYAPMLGTSIDLTGLRDAQEREASKRLVGLAADLRRRGVRADATLKIGAAATTIVDRAKRGSADLILMATQGRGFVKHLLLGSVAERVVRSAPCPVMTLRAGGRLPAKKFKRILIATDFSPASEPALSYAVDLARSSSAELIVLHVVEPVALAGDAYGFTASATMCNEIERAAKQSIARIASQLQKKRGLRSRTVLANGTAAMATVDAATRLRADVVVVGTHGHGGFEHFFLGSVAERVVRTSPRPVLTVPGVRATAKINTKV
jgi:nucleotide-binding universal stress UspA family protein